MDYVSGLDNFLEGRYTIVKGNKVGLVTNHTGLNRNLKSNIDLFFDHSDINLTTLFSPEHGIRGNVEDAIKINNSIDFYTKLPIYSLYGRYEKPTPTMLKDIDILIYDIQDIGVRFYTYLSTLFYCLESCAENNISFIVLDRLNPIGRKVEGNLVQPNFQSFFGLYPLPQRHGMTVGELSKWMNSEFNIEAELKVIKLRGWHGEYFDQMEELLWIPPSPNIPHFGTAVVYPITCLFEGTNISEGRGTTNPFEYIGAPWIDPYKLNEYLKEKALAGILFRPVFFVPTFSKHKGIECGGVQVLIKDRDRSNSFLTGLTLLRAILDLYPNEKIWLEPDEGDKYFFDLLMGTDQVRKELNEGKEPIDIINSWQKDKEQFMSVRRKHFMY